MIESPGVEQHYKNAGDDAISSVNDIDGVFYFIKMECLLPLLLPYMFLSIVKS